MREEAFMTEQEWLMTDEWWSLLNYLEGSGAEQALKGKSWDRKWLLFACASVRDIWNLITEPASRQTVEAAERYADGLATAEELTQLAQLAEQRAWPTRTGLCPYTADYVASQLAITSSG